MAKYKEYTVNLILRVGLAFVFLYAGIAAFISPDNWVGYVPSFIEIFLSREVFLQVHSVIDIALGLWLLSNRKIFYASIVSSVFLFGIVIFNLRDIDILFRDIAILLMAAALARAYSKQ